MILNVSGRTDIVAFYSDWFIKRYREGFVDVRNPFYNKQVSRIYFSNVDAILFCTKNPIPIVKYLTEIDKPIVFHVTLTPYKKDIEPNVPDLEQSIYTFKELSERYGKDKVIWRYDPILFNKEWTYNRHIQNFQYINKQLCRHAGRVVLNFVSLYEKVKRHMPDLKEVSYNDKVNLIHDFVNISSIPIQTCGNGLQFKDLEGVEVTGCLDEHALNLMGIYPKAPKGNAVPWGCLCYPNTCIGEYNTCLHKCKYCYASADFDKCDENFTKHDPKSPLLIGWPRGDEKIIEMKPKLLNTKQLKLEF